MFVNKFIAVIADFGCSSTFRTRCPFCGKYHNHTVPYSAKEFLKRLDEYKGGLSYIQDIFPELSADVRESITTGICAECIALMKPDEDDEDDYSIPEFTIGGNAVSESATFAEVPSTGTVTLNGHEYKTWDIECNGDVLRFAEADLESHILDGTGGYLTEDARFVDEQIAYFVSVGANVHKEVGEYCFGLSL